MTDGKVFMSYPFVAILGFRLCCFFERSHWQRTYILYTFIYIVLIGLDVVVVVMLRIRNPF